MEQRQGQGQDHQSIIRQHIYNQLALNQNNPNFRQDIFNGQQLQADGSGQAILLGPADFRFPYLISGDQAIPVTIHLTNDMPTTSTAGEQSDESASLKVEDALNYLDQVKYKFGNQAEIYNDFLDIMKEFKSQSIDMVAVISRVSQLFQGHPELILGFNAFLPEEYRIEVKITDQPLLGSATGGIGYQVTTVHTPTTPGVLAQPEEPSVTTPVPVQVQLQSSSPRTPLQWSGSLASLPGSGASGGGSVASTHAISPLQLRVISLPPNVRSSEGTGMSPSAPALPPSFGSPSVHVQQSFPILQSSPRRLTKAIIYIEKIKARLHSQPEKLRKFMHVLYEYQKEQSQRKDSDCSKSSAELEAEVYYKIAKLFDKEEEDLLAEFSQFLQNAGPQPLLPSGGNTANAGQSEGQKSATKEGTKKPPKEKKSAMKAFQENAEPPASTSTSVQPPSTSGASVSQSSSVNPTKKGKRGPKPGSGKSGTRKISGSAGSYDKVQLPLPEEYSDFLRVLVLFDDLKISRSEVLQRAEPFLTKAPQLLEGFQDFVGRDEPAANQQPKPARSMGGRPPKLTEARVSGASYYAVPKNRKGVRCSGRDKLCNEVLNDDWISHSNLMAEPGPENSSSSRDSGSKKKQSEEDVLTTVEDQRFELDIVMEANFQAIICLELIVKNMARMTPEELENFELDDNLGGRSPTINQAAIRRLYGDKAGDIIKGLKKVPKTAVPIVLKRLKAKDAEWREARREFNKIWREEIEDYHSKSTLDQQGDNSNQEEGEGDA